MSFILFTRSKIIWLVIWMILTALFTRNIHCKGFKFVFDGPDWVNPPIFWIKIIQIAFQIKCSLSTKIIHPDRDLDGNPVNFPACKQASWQLLQTEQMHKFYNI